MSTKAVIVLAEIIGGSVCTLANGFPMHDLNSWLGFAAYWCLAIALIAVTS